MLSKAQEPERRVSMFETMFRNPIVQSNLRASVFGKPLEDLAAFLTEQGYSLSTVHEYLCTAGHFAYWQRTRMSSGSTLSEATVDRFLNQHLRQCHCPVPRWNRLARARLSQFMKVLRTHGLVSEPPM